VDARRWEHVAINKVTANAKYNEIRAYIFFVA